jgi:hypothetical protein
MLPVIVILHLVANAPADDLLVVGGFQPAVLARFDAVTGTAHGAPLAGPHVGVLGMTDGPDGLLYVASEGSHSVLRYDAQSGAFIDAFVADDPTTPGDESGGLTQPTAVVFGPDGKLYVASFDRDQILRYDGVTGAYEAVAVASNAGALNGPDLGMAFGPDGALYVPSYWNHRVKRYDVATGAFLGDVLEPLTTPLRNPREILFLGDGSALVASEGSDQVLRFDPLSGAYIGVLVGDDPTTPGDESGGLDAPVGLRLGIGAELWVTSIGNDAVKRYALRTGAFLGDLVGPTATPTLPTGLVAFPRWSTVCAGTLNSTGREATLHASGLTSLSSQRLRLAVVDVPVGELLAMFVGANAPPTPLFGGVLCLGGARTLVGVSRANLSGRASVSVLLQGQAHQAGDVLHAQCVYRDPLTPGGSGANLSSSITFTLAP